MLMSKRELQYSKNIIAGCFEVQARKRSISEQGKRCTFFITKHAAVMNNTSKRDAQGNVQTPEAILYYSVKIGSVDKIN